LMCTIGASVHLGTNFYCPTWPAVAAVGVLVFSLTRNCLKNLNSSATHEDTMRSSKALACKHGLIAAWFVKARQEARTHAQVLSQLAQGNRESGSETTKLVRTTSTNTHRHHHHHHYHHHHHHRRHHHSGARKPPRTKKQSTVRLQASCVRGPHARPFA
jgi:hypothetical protein